MGEWAYNLWQANISKEGNNHLLYKDEVGCLQLHLSGVLIIAMVSPMQVDEHWSFCVEYCSTVRSHILAPV